MNSSYDIVNLAAQFADRECTKNIVVSVRSLLSTTQRTLAGESTREDGTRSFYTLGGDDDAFTGRIVFVTAYSFGSPAQHFEYTPERLEVGRLYTRTLLARLILTFPNATVTVVSHGLPLDEFEHASLRSIFTAVDHDFVFLASARRLLTSIRGFSRLVGDLVGHAGGRVVSMGGAFGCEYPRAEPAAAPAAVAHNRTAGSAHTGAHGHDGSHERPAHKGDGGGPPEGGKGKGKGDGRNGMQGKGEPGGGGR